MRRYYARYARGMNLGITRTLTAVPIKLPSVPIILSNPFPVFPRMDSWLELRGELGVPYGGTKHVVI